MKTTSISYTRGIVIRLYKCVIKRHSRVDSSNNRVTQILRFSAAVARFTIVKAIPFLFRRIAQAENTFTRNSSVQWNKWNAN